MADRSDDALTSTREFDALLDFDLQDEELDTAPSPRIRVLAAVTAGAMLLGAAATVLVIVLG